MLNGTESLAEESVACFWLLFKGRNNCPWWVWEELKCSTGGERQMFFYSPAGPNFSQGSLWQTTGPKPLKVIHTLRWLSSASTACLPALHISTCYTWGLDQRQSPPFLLFEIPSQFILVFASFVCTPRWPTILQFGFIGCPPPPVSWAEKQLPEIWVILP